MLALTAWLHRWSGYTSTWALAVSSMPFWCSLCLTQALSFHIFRLPSTTMRIQRTRTLPALEKDELSDCCVTSIFLDRDSFWKGIELFGKKRIWMVLRSLRPMDGLCNDQADIWDDTVKGKRQDVRSVSAQLSDAHFVAACQFNVWSMFWSDVCFMFVSFMMCFFLCLALRTLP